MTAPRGPVEPPDVVATLAAELLDCWDRSITNFARVLGGSYTSADAADDLSACSAKALEWSGGALAFWAKVIAQGSAGPRTAAQPSSRIPGRVDPAIGHRPLTLHTTGFRAIGYGTEYFIYENDVTFEPSPNIEQASDGKFVLNVEWHHLPAEAQAMTIIYEGEVTAVETGALVTAPIRFVKPAFSE
jgi:hypothetical protein